LHETVLFQFNFNCADSLRESGCALVITTSLTNPVSTFSANPPRQCHPAFLMFRIRPFVRKSSYVVMRIIFDY